MDNMTIETDGGFIRVSGTEAQACRLLASRQQVGLAKYRVSVDANPLSLREWLVHQQEELADALVYCTRAIAELDKQVAKEPAFSPPPWERVDTRIGQSWLPYNDQDDGK